MKHVLIATVTVFAFCASTAFAETTPDLTRRIEDRAASAQDKTGMADAAFASGDVSTGCKSLVGAARDLDASIDMSLQVADRVHNDHGIDEGTRSYEQSSVNGRLETIVSQRTRVQATLEQRCVSS